MSVPTLLAALVLASGLGVLWEIAWERHARIKAFQEKCRHHWAEPDAVMGSYWVRSCTLCKKQIHCDSDGKPAGPDKGMRL